MIKNPFNWLLLFGLIILPLSLMSGTSTQAPGPGAEFMYLHKAAPIDLQVKGTSFADLLPWIGGVATSLGLVEKLTKGIYWISRRFKK